MTPNGPLPASQKTATGPNHEPIESGPNLTPYFSKIHSNFIPKIFPSSLQVFSLQITEVMLCLDFEFPSWMLHVPSIPPSLIFHRNNKLIAYRCNIRIYLLWSFKSDMEPLSGNSSMPHIHTERRKILRTESRGHRLGWTQGQDGRSDLLTDWLTNCQLKVIQTQIGRLQGGSSEEDSREGQVKKTPEKVKWSDCSRGSSKEDRLVLRSGNTPHDINPLIVTLQLKSGRESQRGSRPRQTDWLTD
jgi:hypothetical protein